MLCVSAVIAVARCLSVRLSVTLVHCIHTTEDIVKFLWQSGSHIILVFPQRWYPILRGTLSAGTQNTNGVRKFCDFLTEIAVYLENGTR